MGVIVALVNQKGGCAKTTTAIHFSLALAARNYRVLLVDLDPQGHATVGLGVSASEEQPSLSEVLFHTPLTGVGPTIEQAVVAARRGLDLVPSNLGLAAIEPRLASVPGREERLSEHLAELVTGWDVIFLDCPPNLGLLTINALVAAREALIPFEPSPFALQGAERVLETLEIVKEQTGHKIVPRLLPVMVAARDRYAQLALAQMRDAHPGMLIPAPIRRSILFARSAACGKGIGEIAPRARAWRDYQEAAATTAAMWEDARALLRPRFAGLCVVEGGVSFTHPDLRPDEIRLAGEFNGWVPDGGVETIQGEKGRWRKFLAVEPGRYEYKFVFEEKWMPDPGNPRRIRNNHGTHNSLIDVSSHPPDPRRGPGRHAPDP